MKIPNCTVGNGYYGFSSDTYDSDPDDQYIISPPSEPEPNYSGDFSEYLWMENEEEFDEMVTEPPPNPLPSTNEHNLKQSS